MNAFTIAEVVATSSFLSVALFLATDAPTRSIIRNHWKVLLLLVCMTTLWRWPFNGTFFHGLEYEDSYVYTAAARAPAPPKISEGVGSAYLISTCVVGSLAGFPADGFKTELQPRRGLQEIAAVGNGCHCRLMPEFAATAL